MTVSYLSFFFFFFFGKLNTIWNFHLTDLCFKKSLDSSSSEDTIASVYFLTLKEESDSSEIELVH